MQLRKCFLPRTLELLVRFEPNMMPKRTENYSYVHAWLLWHCSYYCFCLKAKRWLMGKHRRFSLTPKPKTRERSRIQKIWNTLTPKVNGTYWRSIIRLTNGAFDKGNICQAVTLKCLRKITVPFFSVLPWESPHVVVTPISVSSQMNHLIMNKVDSSPQFLGCSSCVWGTVYGTYLFRRIDIEWRYHRRLCVSM